MLKIILRDPFLFDCNPYDSVVLLCLRSNTPRKIASFLATQEDSCVVNYKDSAVDCWPILLYS